MPRPGANLSFSNVPTGAGLLSSVPPPGTPPPPAAALQQQPDGAERYVPALHDAVLISQHPSNKRACFPADCLPPFQHVNDDGLRQLFHAPSHLVTAAAALSVGVTAGALVARGVSGRPTAAAAATSSSHSPPSLVFLGGAIAAVGAVGATLRWAAKRTAQIVPVSSSMNVSSNPNGPCIVTARALLLTNSHAGTHADTTAHFYGLDCKDAPQFQDWQYTGKATLVDVSGALGNADDGPDGVGKPITPEVFCEAVGPSFDWANVERLLLCTYSARKQLQHTSPKGDVWDPEFSYLVPDTVKLLRQRCPRLVMIGIDTPSVDCPNAAPICAHSHGELAPAKHSRRQPVAIVENLDFACLRHTLERAKGCMHGEMQTMFNPMAEFVDARGCLVNFFPPLVVSDDDTVNDAPLVTPNTEMAAVVECFEADEEFGFLEPPRTLDGNSLLPPDAAWNDLRQIVDGFMLGPCEPTAYRDAVMALEEARGEAVAVTTEAAVECLSEAEIAHVYSTLTLMAQKFIYADPSDVRDFIPRCIGRAWIKVAHLRGTPLTLTYDAIVIGNWRLRDPTRPASIDNVDALITVNGADPERGFIRVHVAIEAAGGDLPRRMLGLEEEIESLNDAASRTAVLNEFLTEATRRLEQMRIIVGCMWKEVSRDEYWKQVRVTLLGSPESAFPNGVKILSTDTILYRKGGSGAQSPLMHAFDRFFAVDHVDPDIPLNELSARQRLALRTLEAPPQHARRFIDEQIAFMSARHRKFHERLHEVSTVRELVHSHGDRASVELYNKCVGELEKWRKVHQKVTHRYIADKATPSTTPAKPPRRGAMTPPPVDDNDGDVAASAGEAHVTHSEDKTGGGTAFLGANRGTQNSNFVPLLAQLISETQAAQIPIDDHDGDAAATQ